MTNRQSNIIFYSIISIIIYAIIINYAYPDFFDDFTKSKEEILIKEAVDNKEHNKALTIYQQLIEKRISDGSENTSETAAMYQDMASLYLAVGNKEEEKNYYLKSLKVQEQLDQSDLGSLVSNYDKLGKIAEEEKEYAQAQMYFEKSLAIKIGNTKEEDEGLFVGMQNTRQRYLRLNNEQTIVTLKKLANIHNIKKEYAIAKTYYEKALTASKLTFGEDDSKTLEIMNLMNRITL